MRAGRLQAALRSPFAIAVLISTVVFAGALTLRAGGALEALELTAYDWYLRSQRPTRDDRITLIVVTESDIQRLGRWPLPDAIVAEILDRLLAHAPRAIGLDLYRDIPMPPGTDELTAVLARNPSVLVVTKIGDAGSAGVAAPPVLATTDQVGFSDVVVDRGGIVRRGLLFVDRGGGVAYSLALRAALRYLARDGIRPQPDPRRPEHLRLGLTTIRPLESNDGPYVRADAAGYQFLLDFRTMKHGFPTVSASQVLDGTIGAEAVKGKIVFVGVAADSVKDHFYTPYSRSRDADEQVAGVALHAHIASQLLRAGLDGAVPLRTTGAWPQALWLLLWSLLGGLSALGTTSVWRFAALTGGGLLALGTLSYGAFALGWWVPLVPPALTWIAASAGVTAYTSYQERRQRAQLMTLFSRHISPEVAETIWQQRDEFLDGGRPRPQRLIATVLFTDLVGFTAVSESRSPQALVEWLNEYMEAMAQHVTDRQGLINKYIGDAIMAIFGVPVPRDTEEEIRQDAVNAVECALGMERSLYALNQRWKTEGLPAAMMRIGIFTGPVVAGSIGSARRLEYTVIGDTVNTASRLESYAKDLLFEDPAAHPCRILIGETTARYLDDRFEMRAVGEVELKGKQHKIAMFQILGRHVREVGQEERR